MFKRIHRAMTRKNSFEASAAIPFDHGVQLTLDSLRSSVDRLQSQVNELVDDIQDLKDQIRDYNGQLAVALGTIEKMRALQEQSFNDRIVSNKQLIDTLLGMIKTSSKEIVFPSTMPVTSPLPVFNGTTGERVYKDDNPDLVDISELSSSTKNYIRKQLDGLK